MSEQTKAWAVVSKRGRILAVGLTQANARFLACKEVAGMDATYWRDLYEHGYRCIPVTITNIEKLESSNG